MSLLSLRVIVYLSVFILSIPIVGEIKFIYHPARRIYDWHAAAHQWQIDLFLREILSVALYPAVAFYPYSTRCIHSPWLDLASGMYICTVDWWGSWTCNDCTTKLIIIIIIMKMAGRRSSCWSRDVLTVSSQQVVGGSVTYVTAANGPPIMKEKDFAGLLALIYVHCV